MNTKTKLFPNDPLFWALVNCERREVERYKALFPWFDVDITFPSVMRHRHEALRNFAYGYMREERKRNPVDTPMGDQLRAFLEDALKGNGLDPKQTDKLWEYLKDDYRFYELMGKVACEHEAVLTTYNR